MSKPITASRRAAFLKALAETGNRTLSAERAKLSSSWVGLQRRRDPAFDAACEAALGEAREQLGGGEGTRPPAGWGHLDGVELVVRGTGGSPGRRGAKRVQIARARLHQWDARVEDRFIATLAATCNVKAACAAVGMTQTSAYEHRKRWRGFAARWDEAEEIGDSRIAAALTTSGINLFSSRGAVSCETPIPCMTVAEAIHVLAMHQRRTRGIGKRPGRSPREPSIEEVYAGINRKLDAMERERPVSEADKARDRAVYAARRRAAGRG